MEQHVEALVVRSRDGDTRAFDLLVERFQRRVFYTILRVVRDTHLADDLTQEVFLRAYRTLGELRDPHRSGAWLTGIARQVCREWRRGRLREQSGIPRLVTRSETAEVAADAATPRVCPKTAPAAAPPTRRKKALRSSVALMIVVLASSVGPAWAGQAPHRAA